MICTAHPILFRVIKSRRMRWTGHVASMWGEETRIQGCWGNLKEKKPLGKSRCRWEDNIKMDI